MVVAIPVAALLLAGAVFLVLQRQQHDAGKRVDHTYQVRRQIQVVLIDLVDAETGERGYLLARRDEFLEPYRSALVDTNRDLGSLITLVGDNPVQETRAKRVQSLVGFRIDFLQRLLATASTSGPTPVALLVESKASMDAVRRELARMDAAEARLLTQRTAREDRLTRGLNLAMAGVLGLGLVGGIAAALLFATGVARRVERLDENAQRLQDELPLEPLPPGRDEVGRLSVGLERASQLLSERAHSLREAQAFLDHLITASPVVVLGLTLEDLRVTYVSANVERIFGYRSEDVLGASRFFTERCHPDDREELAEATGRVAAGEQVEVEYRVRHGSGDYHWVHVMCRLEPSEAGAPASVLAYFTDVTERKRMEEDLEAAHDQALEASRLKSEFLANMSHEIRTPLNGVIGMTGLLLDTDLSADQRDYAATARVSGEALLTVINDILDFSKIEAGKMDLESVDFDLRAAVEEAADLLADQAHAKEVELATLIHPDVPLDVQGDPGRLRQVLINLIGNAVKFTEAGEVVVRVGLEEATGEGALVRFEVADTGIGLGPEDTTRLFQGFTQADASTTRKYGGTGLGLAISKQLVELMGGRMGVESDPGQGATFWFTARLAPAAAPVPRFVVQSAHLEGLRVLAVDDNMTNRTILQETLTSWRMHPALAEDGAQALAAMREAAQRAEAFDLAILDYHMPGMDGLELARAIRNEPAMAATRLVLLTSSGQRAHARTAREAGVDAFLTKPIRQSALFDAVATVMGLPAGPRQPLVTTHALAEARARTRAHLLVVEDNPVNQKVAARMLEKLGYRVDVAADGLEAVEAISRIPYAAILMDCQMPDMDGYEATAEIRRRQTDGLRTPIIAMTAGAMRGDQERALAAGMDDYVAKPVNMAELAAALDRWVPAPPTVPSPAVPPGDETDVLDGAILAGLRQLEDDAGTGTLDDLVTSFLGDAASRLQELRVAARDGDREALARVAHSLKGSSANMGALRMARLCAEVEQAAVGGDLGAVEDALARIEIELSRVDGAMQAAFPGAASGRRGRGDG